MGKTEFDPRRTIFVSGSISERQLNRFRKQYCALVEVDVEKPINVIMYSDGGAVEAALAMYDLVRNVIPVKRLNMVATGMVASAAVLVYLAGDYRYMGERAALYLHPVGRDLEGRFSPRELDRLATEGRDTEQRCHAIYAERTGHSISEMARLMAEEMQIRGPEAISYGFAQEILKR
ncbi:MAG: ATP-dependent Clp protease proteolytic subunit [Patescibacteria group bacterium]